MKKIISFIMAITLIGGLFSCIPVNAIEPADIDKTVSNDKKWVYLTPDTAKKEIVLVEYLGTDTNVIIPELIDGKTVVGVGDAYYDFEPTLFASVKVTSITFPKTVKEINDYFFYQYDGDEGWYRQSEDNLFYGKINMYTISSLSMGCITEFRVAEDNPYLTAEDGVLYNKDKTKILRFPAGKIVEEFTLPESVTKVGIYAFANTKLKRVDLKNASNVLPGVFYRSQIEYIENLNNLTQVPIAAFLRSNLKELPKIEKATSIGEYAFAYCSNLTEVEIPLRVDEVRSHAFYSCKNLKKVDFGKIVFVGPAAFAQCSVLEEAALPDTCQTVCSYAFSNCRKLKMAHLEQVEKIENMAFYKCYALVSLNKYGLTGNKLWQAESIGHSAFKKCTSLKNIYLSNVETIDYAAFLDCTSLSDVSFGKYPSKVYATSFNNTALVNNVKSGMVYIDKLALCYKAPKTPKTYIKIKSGTKYIADYCLYKLKGVKSIYLPKSVKYVYAVNLSSCKDLRRVYIGNKDIELSPVSCQNKYTGKTTYYIKPNAYGAIKHFEEDKCEYKTNWNPDKTKSLKAVGKSKKSAKISWKKQGYVTGYRVYMKTSKNGKWKKVAELKGSNSTSYTKKGLKAGKTYYFRVRAYKTVEDKNYYGAYSASDAAKPKK